MLNISNAFLHGRYPFYSISGEDKKGVVRSLERLLRILELQLILDIRVGR